MQLQQLDISETPSRLISSTGSELEFPLRVSRTRSSTIREDIPSLDPLPGRGRGKQSRIRGSPSGHLSSNDSVFERLQQREREGGVPGSLTRPRDRILEWPVRSNGISRNGSFYLVVPSKCE